jgi:L-threonylcarbamoyladenylate synthase
MEIIDGYLTSSIERAAGLLQKGDVVAFPTETVYGLGADGTNALAVAKVFELKKRPHFDPLILHVSSRDWVDRLVRNVPRLAAMLMDRFWPGPLTLILEKTGLVPDIVTAGLPTVALRMPMHEVALRLIEESGRPVAAPSANPFGYISPTCAEHVAEFLGDGVPLILDGGRCSYGLESTILSFRQDDIRIHRFGAVSIEELSEIVPQLLERQEGPVPEAPGELPYHYAPHTRLEIVESASRISREDSAFLAYKEPRHFPPSRYVRVLSTTGNMREAAANFFSSLIELDKQGVSVIYAERVPDKGLGKAIMERLRKAERKHSVRTAGS